MEYFTGEMLCCDITRPKTYLTPVFERVDGDKLRLHHIEAGALGDAIKCVPLRHLSKQKQKIYGLEEENEKLRQLLYLTETCLDNIGQCGICPLNGIDFEHEDCNCQAIPEMKRIKVELGIER